VAKFFHDYPHFACDKRIPESGADSIYEVKLSFGARGFESNQ